MEVEKKTCIGFDVGKATHRARAVSCKTGEVLFSTVIESREEPIDEALGSQGAMCSWSSIRTQHRRAQ